MSLTPFGVFLTNNWTPSIIDQIWYDENGLVSEDSKYTFTMSANNVIYEARFAPITNISEN